MMSLNPTPAPKITRHDFEIFFPEGFLRFQLPEPTTAHLTLFHIYQPFQGQGIGVRKFCQLSDALELCGIEKQYGRPAPTRLPTRVQMDSDRLTAMYLKTGRFSRGANPEWIVRTKAPEAANL